MKDSLKLRLLEHLMALYEKNTAMDLLEKILNLFNKHPFPNAKLEQKLTTGLTEKDVLLIVYGNQVLKSGVSPLQVLGVFLRDYCFEVVSGVHLLPFYPYSSDDGFAVTDLFAVNPALGSWDDIARIGGNFDLMMDGVFNHLSTQSEWFKNFTQGDRTYDDFFISVEGKPDLTQVVRPRALPLLTEFQTSQGTKQVWTTFSADQVDLNFKNPNVLLAILEAVLFYVSKGARFIRLDAIAFLWKEIGTRCLHLPQTHRIIQLFRAVLDEVAPDVLLVTETNVPHADNLSYFGDGSNEAQLVYNFSLPPLVMHTFRIGRSDQLARWAESLQTPSPRSAFLNFLASHDGIGLNPVRGILNPQNIKALVEQTLLHGGMVSYKHNPDGSQSPYELNITYFDALSNPNSRESLPQQVNRFVAAHAIMLALAGVPAIYFHSLFGSRNDVNAAQTSRIPRRINRQKLDLNELEEELKDLSGLRRQVFDRLKELIQVRRAHSAFHPQGRQIILAEDQCVFALLRISPDESDQVLCLHNVTNSYHPTTLKLPARYSLSHWINLCNGEKLTAVPPSSLTITLAPYGVTWLGLK